MGQGSSKRTLQTDGITKPENKKRRRGKTETHDQYCFRTSSDISNQKETTTTSVAGGTMPTSTANSNSTLGCVSTLSLFQSFQLFTDDIKILILAFVADGPFELIDQETSATSTSNTRGCSGLTHTLPLVCKQFAFNYCVLDTYWKAALLRQMKKNVLWKRCILKELEQQQQRIAAIQMESAGDETDKSTAATTATESTIKSATTGQENSQTTAEPEKSSCDENETILEQLLDAKFPIERNETHEKVPPTPGCHGDASQSRCKKLYRHVLNEHMRYIGPVFCMPHPIRIGEPYGLHFFENRYRLLIATVTNTLDDRYKTGEHVIPYNDSTPTFVHAHTVPITEDRTVGVLVRIVRCHIYNDGRADVLLVPYQYVVIEKIWTLPNTGNLNYSQTRKITDYEVNKLHRLQHQHRASVQENRQRRFRLLRIGLSNG